MISSVDHGARVVAICSSLPSRRKEELILHWVDRAVRSHIADKLEELGHGEDANKLRARSRLAAMSELKNFVAEVDVRLARAASGTELALTTALLAIVPSAESLDDSLKAAAMFTVVVAILAGAGQEEAATQVREAKDPGPQ